MSGRLRQFVSKAARAALVSARRYALVVAIGLIVVTFAVAVLVLVPKIQVPSDPALSAKERFDIENSARLTIAQIGAGLLAIGILYFTWRRVTAAEKTVALSQEGQITERFTRAIEQLGSTELSIRLGGIYALERIARDSERDHWPIMEVLTAYVRENALRREMGKTEDRSSRPGPPADIQAIITVLGRRERSEGREGPRRLDLTGTDLREADMDGAHLERADLGAACLDEAHLSGAHLEEADLSYAHLEGAFLGGTHLEGAGLFGAHLQGARLGGTHLERADLGGADLQRADMGGADLHAANLVGACLVAANLIGARLEDADLGGAHLGGSFLGGAHLDRANLRVAELGGADLSGVTGLSQEQVSKAITDRKTRLPDYFTAKDSGD